MTQLDLNLLVAFDCLLEEGSVQAAADRLGLSSPAMSRTLSRIRRVTGDQILVRTGRTMVPTTYALSVRARVHELVQAGHAVLQPSTVLDLAALERIFTLQCHDALISALAPNLLAAVRSQAPGVTLRFLAETANDSPDLRRDRVDLMMGSVAPPYPDTRSVTWGAGALVVVLRQDHPLAVGPLSVEAYAGAEHVLVSRRGRLDDAVDAALRERGLTRHVIGSVPTTVAALRIVSQSDVVSCIPETVCRHLVDAFDLATTAVPLDLDPVSLVVAWHQRYDGDSAHQWLREQVRLSLPGTLPGSTNPHRQD